MRFVSARKGRTDGWTQRRERRKGWIRLSGVPRGREYPCPAEKHRSHPSRESPERSRKGKTRPEGKRHRHGSASGNGRSRIAHPKTGRRAERARRKNAGGAGRPRRPGQRGLQDGAKHRTEAGRTGGTGRRAMAFHRAAACGRRGISRETQRREIHPPGGGIGGPAEDRQLRLHDDRSEPGGVRHQRRRCGIGIVRYPGTDRRCRGRCWTGARIFETRPTMQGPIARCGWKRGRPHRRFYDGQ
mmetsp:Transcript_26701/g.62716  ORF Transcript_26701/g.62716 Transcript_26701/m.62716 type:complete len:243 (+) Transcript_26701:589-1317(+)